MRKLTEVREAKDLMKAALEWSTFKWLLEKPRVRVTADRANAALDKLERAVKGRWSDDAKNIYKSLSQRPVEPSDLDDQSTERRADKARLVQMIEAVLTADRAAERARTEAEDTFDRAERQMSVSLAREGCNKAIHSWALHERAIRKAEAVAHPSAAGGPGS